MEETTDKIEEQTPAPAPKLKPVTYPTSPNRENQPKTMKQILLLNAMQTTQNPEKIKTMIGARNIAEVERVFDTLANQKEFQKSLRDKGLTYDFLTGKLKEVIDTAEKDADIIKAIQIVMQASGVDKFVVDPTGAANWQDLLLRTMAKRGEIVEGELVEDEQEEEELEMYEVTRPEMPEGLRSQDLIEGAHGHTAEEVVDDAVDDVLKKIYE